MGLLASQKTFSQPKHPATFYCIKGSADIRWRVELPVRHLKARLVTMRKKDTRALTSPNLDQKFPWVETPTGSEYPEHEGVAVWTRPCMVRAIHAAAMSQNGITTVAEVDDNYLSDPTQNIFMKMNNYNRIGRRSHMQAMASFDKLIFSTVWLRDEYVKAYKKDFGYKPEEIHVCRNHVDPDDWEHRIPLLPPGDGRLRVGYMGSHQHVLDIRLAAPALRLAKDMGCEIIFVGLDPAWHDPKWREFLGTYTHVNWFTPRQYHKTSLNFDIGLIPLVMNNHTLGKSDVKALEYGMSGAAVIAQNNSVYNRSLKHGETALLAGGPDEMALQLHELIRNQRLRKELAANLKQYVLEERTMQKQGVVEWREAIS